MKSYEDSYLVSGVKIVSLSDSVYLLEQVVSLLIAFCLSSQGNNVRLGSLFYCGWWGFFPCLTGS